MTENGPDSQLSGPFRLAERTIRELPRIEVRPLFQRVFPRLREWHTSTLPCLLRDTSSQRLLSHAVEQGSGAQVQFISELKVVTLTSKLLPPVAA